MKKRIWMTLFSVVFAICMTLGGGFMLKVDNNTSVQAETTKTIDMYLIGGQSNAAGYSYHNDTLTETFANVGYGGETDKWRTKEAVGSRYLTAETFKWGVTKGLGSYASRVGPEYGMAKVFNSHYSQNNRAFIFKSAAGGTSLRNISSGESDHYGNWYPRSLWTSGFTPSTASATGLQYHNFIENFKTVYDALRANGYTVKVKGMAWMQGCADLGANSAYKDIIDNFIADIRSDLVAYTGDQTLTSMPFVIGKIASSAESYNNPKAISFNLMQEQVAKTIEAVDTIDTADLLIVKEDGTFTGADNWHFGPNEMVELGQRFGQKLLEMNASNSTSTTTSTWTSGGKTYTFEGDISKHNTTDIRDLGVHDLLQTADGVTGSNVSNTNKYVEKNCMIHATDAPWVKKSGGVSFKFKTNSEWYTPAGVENSEQRAALNGDTWISVYYGDLWIQFVFGNWGLKTMYAMATTFDAANNATPIKPVNGADSGKIYFNGDTFVDPDGNGKYEMGDWIEAYITKTACTAVSDGSTPTGYWFRMTMKTKIGGVDTELLAFNTYVAKPMYNSERNDFGIGNECLHRMTNEPFICTEPEWVNHRNLLTVKSLQSDSLATATVEAETYKDVAEMTAENETLANKYLEGFTEGSYGRYEQVNDFMAKGTKDSVGLEVRAKVESGLTTPSRVYIGVMTFQAGASNLIINYSSYTKKIAIYMYNSTGSYEFDPATTYQWDYDINAQYAWRITRTSVRFNHAAKAGYGSILRLYMGKIGADGNPEKDWDEQPIFITYDPGLQKANTDDKNGLLVHASTPDNYDASALTMSFVSNKFVRVTTVVDGEATLNRVERGSNYTLPTFGEDILCLGWSKGAAQYSAEDFIAHDTVFENIQTSGTYTAYRVKLVADTKAALRYRQRMISGSYLDPEVALRWNGCMEILDDVVSYFGSYTLGVEMSINYSLPGEESIRKCFSLKTFTANEDKFEFAYTQSGISETWYGRTFTCRPYIEVAGKKIFTAERDMNEHGRSVDFVAEATIKDLRKSEVIEDGYAYINEIWVDGEFKGYHYLTQGEYDLIAEIASGYTA